MQKATIIFNEFGEGLYAPEFYTYKASFGKGYLKYEFTFKLGIIVRWIWMLYLVQICLL